jgi:ABC-type sugar transport system permease subunit
MPASRRLSRLLRVLIVAAVVLLALGLRLRAVALLPIDYDEDDYLRAATRLAGGLAASDWGVLLRENYRPEHPQLAKLAFGLALAPLPAAPEITDRPTTDRPAAGLPQPHLTVARTVAALFGALGVLVVALLDPLAGLLLGVHTWQIKYTSQVMLESLPAATSALSVLAYTRTRATPVRGVQRPAVWLALSALALGLSVAGKYLYAVAGLAIALDWALAAWRAPGRRAAALRLAGWALLAVGAFVLADPYLWPAPLARLSDSLFYHGAYARSAGVAAAGFPVWQPLVWLAGPVPWHPGTFLFELDLAVSALAVAGFATLWRRQRVYGLWLLLALGILLVWPTKWPQYILVLTVPLSLAASQGLRLLVRRVDEALRARIARRTERPAPGPRGPAGSPVLPWLLPGLATLAAIAVFPLIFQTAMALTDFSMLSFKDGLRGGVWRAAWQGLSGQVAPAPVTAFASSTIGARIEVRDRGEPVIVPIFPAGLAYSDEVHYAGPQVLLRLLAGAGANFIVFEAIWTVASVALQTALGIAVALALSRRGLRFRAGWRALFILPWAIPEFVGALIWAHLFEPTNGWLSLALGRPLYWQATPESTLLVLLLAALWLGWPFMLIAAGAGLQAIPAELSDAAMIDGAAGWTRFRLVTWPLLFPLLAPAIIIRAIFAFNQFYLFFVMRAPWPLLTFATLSYYLFDTNRQTGGQFAISAAINLFTVLALLIFVFGFTRWTRRAERAAYG